MDYFFPILAGLVQGLTEFLPISSTGHLIIFQKLFGFSQESFGLAFDASLHLGTLVAVILFFYKDYLRALKDKDMLIKLVAGTIPAVLLGLILESMVESVFRQISVVASALILFSFVMLVAEKVNAKLKQKGKISAKDAFIMGLFQAIALVPGVSRSGSTISGGLLLGIQREETARFAFILSGPIIAGAGAKKFLEVLSNGAGDTTLQFFLLGILSSAFFGYITIKYFLKFIAKNSLTVFIIYRVILGFVLILLSFFSASN